MYFIPGLPVDGLFQGDGHGGFHGLRVCADIVAADDDLRGRQIWKLCHRKIGQRDGPAKNNQQRTNGSEYGTPYEEIDKQRSARLSSNQADFANFQEASGLLFPAKLRCSPLCRPPALAP